MEKQEIKSITEAFSMQPETQKVWTEKMVWDKKDKNSIKVINFERERINEHECLDYYVGYNFSGKKLFKYLAKSVNVHYK